MHIRRQTSAKRRCPRLGLADESTPPGFHPTTVPSRPSQRAPSHPRLGARAWRPRTILGLLAPLLLKLLNVLEDRGP